MAYRRVLVLGGARSGKSAFAERQALESGAPVIYVATSLAIDNEMAERIARHQADRPTDWLTLEVQTNLADHIHATLPSLRGPMTVIIEDLTLLLANLMEAHSAARAEELGLRELEQLLTLEAHLILVSNEVGMGIVPAYASGRAFRDILGRMNQYAASACSGAYLLVAGLPLRLK